MPTITVTQIKRLTLIKPDPDAPKSHLELAREHLQNNRHKEAAEEFILAGELGKAANLFETIFDYKNAIQHYVKAGQIQTAGDLLIRLGDKKKAARLFEKAKKFDLAIKYYKETESYQELITLFEKSENFFEAFKIAFKIKDLKIAAELAV